MNRRPFLIITIQKILGHNAQKAHKTRFRAKQKTLKRRIYVISEFSLLVRQMGLEPIRQRHTPLKRMTAHSEYPITRL